MESFNNSYTTYILEYYPWYNRNRIRNRFGRCRGILSWSIRGRYKSSILTLFSVFGPAYCNCYLMQFCFWYHVILALNCLRYSRNQIQNRFGSYRDCMSWSMIFFDFCLHYKGLLYFSHTNVNFWTNNEIYLKLISFVLSSMLIYNLQTDLKLVHGMWRYAYKKFPL